jgi:FlaA1/EpsC-like NDP-sugar epimerase
VLDSVKAYRLTAGLSFRTVLMNLSAIVPAATRRYIVIGHDLIAAAFAFLLATFLRFGSFDPIAQGLEPVYNFHILYFALFAGFSYYFRLHLGMWRHLSLQDLLTIMKVASATIIAFYAVIFLIHRLEGVPRSLPLAHWFSLVFVLGGSRLLYRVLRGDQPLALLTRTAAGETVPVLLIGTGVGTSLLIRSVRASAGSPYAVVGIVGVAPAERGRRILGLPVLGHVGDLPRVIRELTEAGYRPTRLIVTGALDPAVMEGLVEDARVAGIALCRMPDPVEFRDASAGARDRIELRPVALEDLLPRPQVVLDQGVIDRFVAGKRVLVTGAGGSIGGELVRQLASRSPRELILVDQGEFNLYSVDGELAATFPDIPRRAVLADVRQRERVMALFAEHRPELVFHAAALKHVPMVELNPAEGLLTNVIGTRNVADAALACGAEATVLISTDKAVNPTNVMGASKRLAEFYCQALDLEARRRGRGRFMTVRFGNVLGSSGSVVPLFQKQLAAGGPLTITHPEIKRYFMTIPEAVGLVLHASAHGVGLDDERGRIFVLDMGQSVRIVDIARRMIRLAGLEPGRDVALNFVGLRPGEKLYEELFDDAEARLPTAIPGVLVAAPRPIGLARLGEIFDALVEAARRDDRGAMYGLIAGVIPGYSRAEASGPAAAPGVAAGPPAAPARLRRA